MATDALCARLIPLAAALLLGACGGGGGGHGDGGSVVVEGTGPERIDAAVAAIRSQAALPGVAVAVVRNGELVIARAYGSADIAGEEPLTPAHLFRVASVSKPITGIAILTAAEEGLLNLQAPAFEVLKAYRPQPGEADPRLGEITVWHLLHHTPGWDLWDYPRGPLFRSKEIADEETVPSPPGPAALVRWVARQPLAFAPGSRFHYTNIGFVALGRVIEESTGYGYEDFVRRFVLEPAGITRARLGGVSRAERLTGEVEYLSQRQPIWVSIVDGTTTVTNPAYGGINLVGMDASSAWVLSVVDLARLGAATDGLPAYPELLSPAGHERMLAVGTPAGGPAYGAGWFLDTSGGNGARSWNHSGGMPGTIALLQNLGNGVIVAMAGNGDASGELLSILVEAVRGITEWPDDDLFDQFP
jgi:CubicO group peptidase (beta-lactamase class C family)